MAITATLVTEDGSSTDQQSYTTASFTQTAGKVYIAWIVNSHGGSAGTPSISGWTQINTTLYSSNTRRVTALYIAPASTSTATVTISISGTNNTGCTWGIVEYDSVDTTDPIVQSATNTANNVSSLTVTLGAFSGTNNATAGGFGINTTTAISAGAGFALVGTSHGYANPDVRMATEFRNDNDTTVNATVSGSVNWGGVAVEIRFLSAVVEGLAPFPLRRYLNWKPSTAALNYLYRNLVPQDLDDAPSTESIWVIPFTPYVGPSIATRLYYLLNTAQDDSIEEFQEHSPSQVVGYYRPTKTALAALVQQLYIASDAQDIDDFDAERIDVVRNRYRIWSPTRAAILGLLSDTSQDISDFDAEHITIARAVLRNYYVPRAALLPILHSITADDSIAEQGVEIAFVKPIYSLYGAPRAAHYLLIRSTAQDFDVPPPPPGGGGGRPSDLRRKGLTLVRFRR